MRFAAPVITAGNVAILKHSSVCLGNSLEIAQVFRDAGFPENVFQVVLGDYRTGESLVQSDIDAVSVTGSVSTGKRVGELATRGLKKFVLELGGSDPFIVLKMQIVNQTAHMVAQSRLLNTGQSCISAKRFIVVKEVVKKFTDLFVEETKAEVVGDPMDYRTTVGPLVREIKGLPLMNRYRRQEVMGQKFC